MRDVKTVLGALMLASVLIGASAASGAGMPAGGAFRVFTTPTQSGAASIVLTGAIGDYGKSVKLAKGYSRFVLKRGTFEIDAATLDAKLARANPAVDLATCSGALTLSGTATVLDGTGLYKGISGTINATVTFAFIGPFYASGKNKGKCNLSNNAPTLAQYGSIQGTGNAKFS